jgi:gliding motility-associated lipoprotein GldH
MVVDRPYHALKNNTSCWTNPTGNKHQEQLKRYTLYIIILLMAIVALTGCNNGRAYDRYRALDIEGWDRSDTVDFNTCRLTPGTYNMYVGFRATSSYPFRDLGININWTVYPSGKSFHKTVRCNVFDSTGHMSGRGGISSDDFLYHTGQITVAKGDSVVFTVSHAMNMDQIPGLTTIGLQLTPSDGTAH